MFDGFNELENELKGILKNVDNVEEILEIGAKEFVDDALKLPKPKSNINSSKHTHLVDSFSYEKSKHKIPLFNRGYRWYIPSNFKRKRNINRQRQKHSYG